MQLTALAAIFVASVACWCDVRTHRLPNVLTFGAALAAVVFRLATDGPGAAVLGLAGFLVGIALFFPVFALRGMSAGDVKLLGALGAWLGPWQVAWIAAYAAIAGGIFAIVVAVARGYVRRALYNIWMLLCHWRVAGLMPLDGMTLDTSHSPRLPYALPIAAGTFVALWLH